MCVCVHFQFFNRVYRCALPPKRFADTFVDDQRQNSKYVEDDTYKQRVSQSNSFQSLVSTAKSISIFGISFKMTNAKSAEADISITYMLSRERFAAVN